MHATSELAFSETFYAAWRWWMLWRKRLSIYGTQPWESLNLRFVIKCFLLIRTPQLKCKSLFHDCVQGLLPWISSSHFWPLTMKTLMKTLIQSRVVTVGTVHAKFTLSSFLEICQCQTKQTKKNAQACTQPNSESRFIKRTRCENTFRRPFSPEDYVLDRKCSLCLKIKNTWYELSCKATKWNTKRQNLLTCFRSFLHIAKAKREGCGEGHLFESDRKRPMRLHEVCGCRAVSKVWRRELSTTMMESAVPVSCLQLPN